MQALGPRDINRVAGPARPTRGKRRAEDARSNNVGGKRQRNEPHIDYMSTTRERPSFSYIQAAIAQIDIDFPMFYKSDVRRFLARSGNFYAPSYIKLYDAAVRNDPRPLGVRKKQKSTARVIATRPADPEFQAEFDWVHSVWKPNYDGTRADRKRRKSLAPLANQVTTAPVVADMGLEEEPDDPSFAAAEQSIKIECGCCFDDECSFITMIQCKDGHLFCRDCVTAQAGTAVGSRQRDILCMDSTGCRQPFPATELQKCLDIRTYDLWQKIVQAEDIAAADLRGFEHCPACDFGMIFEVDHRVAPLFKCLKSDCRLVTCRRCRKPDHTGRPCTDEEDVRLKAEHAVEEAMTQALLRACPGCRVPFVKSDGCNKIKCLNARCGMYSCYLCRQPLPRENPYGHFERDRLSVSNKCRLWDATGLGNDPQPRHAAEVAQAEQLARAQYQGQGRVM